MLACTVPLGRIKAKKIPIVQPNLTFWRQKIVFKNFHQQKQYDNCKNKARAYLLVNGIFLVL
ncbi:hypothetical protein DTW90_01530 [Neorhizobium sp. P12A]|nr:hypothetical protein DTW90_01530 [Neorhizobium sp. P12A]